MEIDVLSIGSVEPAQEDHATLDVPSSGGSENISLARRAFGAFYVSRNNRS
jgi:hypothetical protein